MITQKLNTIELEHQAAQAARSRFGILRLLTCGSVDDGKSTLIGRLLLETGAVYEDHLQSLQLETKRHGTTELAVDPALIVDGLEDERAQGITIDVAYRYLRSPRRKIIIADSPGHEQYTRNMVTAASRSDVALLLVDARKGLLPQTKRHALIASMLGIQRFILAINKMDLVNYQSTVFHDTVNAFDHFAKSFPDVEIIAIPLSGLCGDNVCRRSEKMDWYQGPTLLETLESSQAHHGNPADGFRFPVQRVVRPDSEFRGVSSTIATGKINVHDTIEILPHGKTTTVQSILTMDGEADSAHAGQAVTLTLKDEIDVTRGDWLVSPDVSATVSNELMARLVWMSTDPLVVGKTYWLKCGVKTVQAEVAAVQSTISIETGKNEPAATLTLNEIGHCHLLLHEPIVHESYQDIRELGSFILVDRISHETTAAGLIARGDANQASASTPATTERPCSHVTADQRRARLGHNPLSIVLTGRSKSELLRVAYDLESRLFNEGLHVGVLDEQYLDEGIETTNTTRAKAIDYRRCLQLGRSISDMGLICISVLEVADGDLPAMITRECSQNDILLFDLERGSQSPSGVSSENDKSEHLLESIYAAVVSQISK